MLIVIKVTDYRLSLAEIACMQVMSKFMAGLKPVNTFLAFTHCDEAKPEEEFIKDKMNSF